MAQRNIQIVETKLGVPTILVEHEGKMLPIHSKYNPIAEAERFIDALAEEIEKSDHLLFYGAGLGYHVKIAQERYPEKVFSIYEPIENVSNALVQNTRKTGVNIHDLAKHYVEPAVENIIPNIHDFSIYFAHRVLFVTLPIYEKLVPVELAHFKEYYKKILKEKVGNKQVEKKYGERWIINMIMNAKHTFTTPNLLMQEKNPFEGKTVILAAAGPSLIDEIDNLKYIKEHGLAYIFAVGSANKALLKHDVMPDAVLSYDPQSTNWQVFEEIMERNIDTIPLIFGTTVGYETVDYYPGPKAHVVMSKDTLAPYLHDQEMTTVSDSTTISNVTFQILSKLNVSKIILVGQNFAYRDDQFYAKGIKRHDPLTQQETDGKLNIVEEAQSFLVEDVNGGQVRTNVTFNSMRREMEHFLRLNPHLKVENATKGGAKIEGTSFKQLSEIMNDEMTDSIVCKSWYESMNLSYAKSKQQKLKKIQQENVKFVSVMDELIGELNRLKANAQLLNIPKINKSLERSNKLLDKAHSNYIYKLFVKPIVDLFTEQVYAEVSLCNKMSDIKEKANGIANVYLNYLSNVMNAYEEVNRVIQMNILLPLLDKETMKFYSSTSGVFHYEGNWSKHYLNEVKAIEKNRKDSEVKEKDIHPSYFGDTLVKSTNSNDKIEFRFKGSAMQLLGIAHTKVTIQITIDGKTKNVMLRPTPVTKTKSDFYNNVLVEVEKLSNRLHDVSIEVLCGDGAFIFTGIKINRYGRAYHPQEVTQVEDLTIGKRIRCHYNAKYNMVGEFSALGEECATHLPVEAKRQPSGDFYFIMVDEIAGDKKLIADRNIQNYVSWKTIEEQLSTKKLIPNAFLDLPTGGHWNYRKDKNNDWDRYINDNWFEWNVDCAPLSWMKEMYACIVETREIGVIMRGDVISNTRINNENVITHFDFTAGNSNNLLNFLAFRPILFVKE